MQETNQYTTIDEAVAMAASQLEGTSRSDRKIFRAWAWRAIEQIGPHDSFIKVAHLEDIENLSVRKPDDWLSTRDLAIYAGESEVKHIYTTSRKVHKNNNAIDNIVYIHEDANFIYMDSNAESVDCVIIEYYSLPINDDGEPMMPRSYLTPVETYIKYLHWMKTSQNMGMIGMLKNDWIWQRKNARAKNKMPNMKRGKEIMNQWATMLPRMSQKYLN